MTCCKIRAHQRFTVIDNYDIVQGTCYTYSRLKKWIYCAAIRYVCDPLPQNLLYVTREYFLKYRLINISQVNRIQRNFQEKYWLFMVETLSECGKWYIILELRISAFSASANLKNYFPTLMAGFVGVGHIFCHLIKKKVTH